MLRLFFDMFLYELKPAIHLPERISAFIIQNEDIVWTVMLAG